MKRRSVIGGVAAATALALVPRRSRSSPAQLRPPGALPQGQFEKACIGCFRCAEVCPTGCIRFPTAFSLEQTLPRVETAATACVLCMQCTQVCPTDALTPIRPHPQEVATRVKIGTPRLDRASCLPWNGEGVCRLCYQVCPYPDAAIELVGPQKAPLFNDDRCVGCGLCEEACPSIARAITIIPLGSASPVVGKRP